MIVGEVVNDGDGVGVGRVGDRGGGLGHDLDVGRTGGGRVEVEVGGVEATVDEEMERRGQGLGVGAEGRGYLVHGGSRGW